MRLYCTTKNSGPSWTSETLFMVYLGTSLDEAEKAVGFDRYKKEEKDFPKNFPEIWSAIPREIPREMVRYYMADGWWYRIVRFEIE